MRGEFVNVKVWQGIYPPKLYFKIKLKNTEQWIYNIFAHEAELILSSNHKRIAKCVEFNIFELTHNSEITIEPTFELDYKKLNFIEENRHGRLSLKIALKLVGTYRKQKGDGKWENISEGFSQRGIQTFDVSIHSPDYHDEVVIEQSKWLEVLDKLDYGKIKIIELTIPTISPKTIFERAMKYVDEGKKNLYLGNYDAVLTSCIHVIEEIDRLTSFDNKQTKRKRNLRDALGKEKAEAIKKIKTTFATPFLHFGEHKAREIPVQITRIDAEFALHVTLSILNYFAKTVEITKK